MRLFFLRTAQYLLKTNFLRNEDGNLLRSEFALFGIFLDNNSKQKVYKKINVFSASFGKFTIFNHNFLFFQNINFNQ